jgi:flagellar hook-associated protein 1 FlgK
MDKNSQIDYYDNSGNIIPDIKKRLNAFINVLFREINYYHKSGVTMIGEKGEDFFVPIDSKLPLEMGNVKINDKFSDLDNIVAAMTKKIGDSDVALTIANLHNLNILHDKTGVINADDFYKAVITTIGTESSEVAKITENQNKLVKSADDFRKSISDVSMDEEMANMMKYKYAYGASSKLIGVLNDMLEMVISGLKA